MARTLEKPSHVRGKLICAAGLWLLAGSGFAATNAGATAPQPGGHPPHASLGTTKPAKPAPLIDINSASKAQLKTLYGIGDAEADRIIAARPFLTKTGLVTDAGLPAGLYIANKRKIIAIQKTKPTPKG